MSFPLSGQSILGARARASAPDEARTPGMLRHRQRRSSCSPAELYPPWRPAIMAHWPEENQWKVSENSIVS